MTNTYESGIQFACVQSRGALFYSRECCKLANLYENEPWGHSAYKWTYHIHTTLESYHDSEDRRWWKRRPRLVLLSSQTVNKSNQTYFFLDRRNLSASCTPCGLDSHGAQCATPTYLWCFLDMKDAFVGGKNQKWRNTLQHLRHCFLVEWSMYPQCFLFPSLPTMLRPTRPARSDRQQLQHGSPCTRVIILRLG